MPSDLSTDENQMYVSNNVHLTIDDVLACQISKEEGLTSYNRIVGKFPQRYDDEIKNIISAYCDGREEKEHYSWILSANFID